MTSFWRNLRIVVVVTALLLFALLGLKEGPDGYRDAENNAQRLAGASQILYGGAALVSVWALLRHRRWLGIALTVWAVALTFTGALAPVVWGGSGLVAGALSGALTAIVSGVVTWGALASRRGRR
jgi:hypothetical protein